MTIRRRRKNQRKKGALDSLNLRESTGGVAESTVSIGVDKSETAPLKAKHRGRGTPDDEDLAGVTDDVRTEPRSAGHRPRPRPARGRDSLLDHADYLGPAIAAQEDAQRKRWLVIIAAIIIAVGLTYAFVLRRTAPPGKDDESAKGVVNSVAGRIHVESDPAGAQVAIDGAQRCAKTPCDISGLPLSRELLVTLRHPGRQLWMQRVVLSPTEPRLLLAGTAYADVAG